MDANYIESEFFDFMELIEQPCMNEEIVTAGLDCGLDMDDIEEAYQGEYRNDEEFAQQLADDIGALNDDALWPHNYIDWERAAHDLMFDYSEHDGPLFPRHLTG